MNVWLRACRVIAYLLLLGHLAYMMDVHAAMGTCFFCSKTIALKEMCDVEVWA